MNDANQRQMTWYELVEANTVLKAEVERLRVQLAGCGVAALGGTDDPVVATEGQWGWSPVYQDVLNLRRERDRLAEERDSWKAQSAELIEEAELKKAEARRREREAVAWTLTELTREHALPLGVASLNAEAFAAALNGRYPEVTT